MLSVTKTLRQLLKNNKLLTAPGVFDGLSARLVEQKGFPLIYASGGAIARSFGLPDMGLLSLTEVTDRLASIVNVTSIPVIADADTGFGNVLNVERTVRAFVNAGVAGLHLEDQQFPKRCGHLAGKSLISSDEMCHKLRVAKESVSDPDFLLIARTDAIAVEGFDKALERAKSYVNAGADMIFVEAPETEEQIEAIAKAIPQPKLINMFYGGKTPLISSEKLASLGYSIAIIPSDLQRAAIKNMEITLDEIKREGNSGKIADKLITFNEREDIIDSKRYMDLADGEPPKPGN